MCARKQPPPLLSRAPGLEIRMHLRSSAFAAAICVLAGAAPAAAADPPLTVPQAKLERRPALPREAPWRPARADHARHRHRRHGRRGLRHRQGRLRRLQAPGLHGELPGLHHRRHPGLGAVPRQRDPVDGAPRGPADRRHRHQPGRPAPALRADLLAEPARRRSPTCVAAAGTQHGTALFDPAACASAGARRPCGSRRRVRSSWPRSTPQPDETPGPTAWTTVRSTTDEVVQPQTGPHPTSALKGATNIVDPVGVPRPPGQPHRHRPRLGHLRRLRRRDRPQGRRARLSPAQGRLRDTLRRRPRRRPARTRSSARAATSSRRGWSARCRGSRPSPR